MQKADKDFFTRLWDSRSFEEVNKERMKQHLGCKQAEDTNRFRKGLEKLMDVRSIKHERN